jgi:hypothetical protein
MLKLWHIVVVLLAVEILVLIVAVRAVLHPTELYAENSSSQINTQTPTLQIPFDNKAADKQVELLSLSPDDWIAIFTLALVGATIFQGRLILRAERFTRASLRVSFRQAIASKKASDANTEQLKHLVSSLEIVREAVDATKVAAEAARKSANAVESSFKQLERPYVFFTDLTFIMPPTDEKKDRQIEFSYMNYGRTPALVTSVRARLLTTNDMPKVPYDFEFCMNWSAFKPLSTGEKGNDIEYIIPDWFKTTNDGTREIPVLNPDEKLFFLAEASYWDVFQNSHVSGFCWEYDIADNWFVRIEDLKYHYTT